MKKVLLLLWSVCLTSHIFAVDSQFKLSTEKITITSYDQEEFENSEYYSSDNQFSQGIEIISLTDNITTIFNGTKYYGTELKFNNLGKGSYYVEISREGYEPIKKWISLSAKKRVVVKVELSRDFGHLDIKTNIDNFTVIINGYTLDDYYTLPTGSYRVKIKGFGYKEQEFKVVVEKNRVTHKEFFLETVEFNFIKTKIDKKIFNPKARGGFAINNLTVGVNGPAVGDLNLYDNSGNSKISRSLEFKSWDTKVDLTDLIVKNPVFEDGEYKAVIVAEGKEISLNFTIDSNLTYSVLPIHRGSTGLLKVATGEINSKISQTAFAVGSTFNSSDLSVEINHFTTILPFLQVHGGIDLDIDFNSEISIFTINGGSLFALGNNILKWGVNLNYFFSRSYTQSEDDIISHIVSVNSPFTFKLKPVLLTLSPGYSYSTDIKLFGLGLGCHWDNQQIRAGLSARTDTEDFNEYTLEYGGEVYYLLPGTQSYIGLNITGDKDINIGISVNFSVLY